MRTARAGVWPPVWLIGLASVVAFLLCLGEQAHANAVLPFTEKHSEALGWIESGNNDLAHGKAGEVSRFQIHPAVWKAYSRSREYHDLTISTVVARRHWDSLVRYFLRYAGRSPTDFDVYVLWNTRWGYYQQRDFKAVRVDAHVADRAKRFSNLIQAVASKVA